MLFAFELACDHALEVTGRVVGDAQGSRSCARCSRRTLRPNDEQRLVTFVLTAFVARIPTHPELARSFGSA